MMGDLFGPLAVETAPSRPGAAPPPREERATVFGSRAWTICPCGGCAALHFPNAGGVRRCLPCAKAEGRMKGPNDE